jgi:hypothetical protein
MTYLLIARLRSYTSHPPEEYVWDFGDDKGLALETQQIWAVWMGVGLWQFRDWGWPGKITCIKPGAIDELDFRVVRNEL